MIKYITIFLVVFVSSAHAQALTKKEKELLQHLKLINEWWTADEISKEKPNDAWEKQNELFERQFLNYLRSKPSINGSGLKALIKEGLIIATSPDQKLTIYSWDENTGGTMHSFKNIFQYQVGKELVVKATNLTPDNPENVGNGFYITISTLTINGKTFYLAVYDITYCTSCAYQAIKVFHISGREIEPFKLIKTTSGVKNQLGFEYNFFSVVDRPERPIQLIYYNPKNKTLKIPVVLEKGEVTNRFITYQFTGKYFEKLKK